MSRKFTLPQVVEALMTALAGCGGTLLYFQEVLAEGTPAEKRHARRMIECLSELEGCDVHGARLQNGLQVTLSDGSVFEISVRKVSKHSTEASEQVSAEDRLNARLQQLASAIWEEQQ